MGVATEIYEEMEQALLATVNPRGWLLTSELYRQLDYGGDHFATSDRAIFYRETPKPLYQLPVTLKLGAHHAWKLHTGVDHG